MSDVSVKFGAVDENLNETLDKVQKNLGHIEQQVDNTSKGFGLSFGSIAGAAAVGGLAVKAVGKTIELAFDGARAVVDQFGAALDLGGELNDLSTRTGETAGNLLILQRAFTNNGMEADKVGSSINKMQKYLNDAADGGKAQAEVFDQLGVKLSDMAGKTPTEQMQLLAEKISGLQDPSQRAGIAMDIFGKSGGALLPLFSNFAGEVGGARDQLGSLPGVMDRSAAAFDSIGDNLSVIRGKTLEFAAGFLEKATPALVKFTNMLTGIDAAGWGEKIMGYVLNIADGLMGAFRNPMDAVEALGYGLLSGVAAWGNEFLTQAGRVGSIIGGLFSSEIPDAIAARFGAMWEMIKIQGEIAIKGITYSDAMNNFAATLNAMWDKLTNGADFTESFNKYAQAGKEVTSEVVDELKNKLKATNEQFDRTWNESGNKISSELKRLIDEATGLETVDFLGVKEFSEKSEEAMKRMTESGAAFRNEMIGANNAVANAAVNAGGINNSADNFQRKVGEAKNDMIVIKNMGDLIAAAKMAQPAQTFAQQVKQAREDLKELSLFLGGDFSKMSIVDIAKRLDIPVARKESKELFAEIQQYIKDANKNPLAFRIDKDATKEDLYEIEKAIADMKAGKEVDLNATPALRKLHMGLENVGGQPVQVKLDAASSINQIRGEMSKQIDLSLSSSTGTSILTAINTAVSAIKACVEKIEPKLPQTALGF